MLYVSVGESYAPCEYFVCHGSSVACCTGPSELASASDCFLFVVVATAAAAILFLFLVCFSLEINNKQCTVDREGGGGSTMCNNDIKTLK